MLEGTLESFTLPDIFQLLAYTKKTGCLRLRSSEADGNVYFKDGEVYYAVSTGGRLALGRRLVGAGLVDTEALQRALERQRDAAQDGRGLRIGQVLVETGAISEDTLEAFVREQIQDAVFDLMRWTEGTFTFDMSGNAVISEPIELSVSVENLIMEGSRRLEEWESVHRKIPTRDAVVAMAALPGDSGVEVNLTPEEWRLLTLVDGRRTVADLVDIFGQGEFATSKVLYGLVGAGLLEVRDPQLEGLPSVAAVLEQHELLRALEEDAVPSRPAPAEQTTPTTETAPEAAAATDADDHETPMADRPEEPAPTPGGLKAKVSTPEAASADAGQKEEGGQRAAKPEQRLTTDPSIDEDLVRRLIDGVKGL